MLKLQLPNEFSELHKLLGVDNHGMLQHSNVTLLAVNF
jgi:hypothetical protein